MDLLTATFAVLLIWIAQIAVLIGMGLLVLRLAGSNFTFSDGLLACFWPGYTAAIAILQLWHLMLPVDGAAAVTLTLLGLLGIGLHRTFVFDRLKDSWQTHRGVALICLTAFAIWNANLALEGASTFDNGNYHLTSIRWTNTVPLVKGIGNLDGHFAFNSATFLHHAALEFGFWQGKSNHIATGPLLLVLFLQIFSIASRLFQRSSDAQPRTLAPILLLTPLTFYMLRDDFRVSSPGTDMPVLILVFVLSLLAWQLSAASCSLDLADRERMPDLAFQIACAAAAAATIKASSWVFVAVTCGVSLFTLLRAENVPHVRRRHSLIASFVLLSMVLGTWVWRSVLLSGYPLFPAAFLPFPVEWRIPTEYASWQGWFISAFARGAWTTPDDTAEHWTLIPLWFASNWRGLKIEAMLPVLLALVAGLFYFRADPARRSAYRSVLVSTRLSILPSLIALAVWLVSTPSIRFGGALVWVAFSVPAGAAIGLFDKHFRRYPTVIACLLPLLGVGQHLVTQMKTAQPSIISALSHLAFVPCRGDSCVHPPLTSELVKITTRFGLEAYTPKVRTCDDSEFFKCVVWDGPLPSAQAIRPTLAYLNPARPMEGFVTRERPNEWAQVFGPDVKRARAENGWNVRELAMRFRVHPRYIRQALGIPETER